MTTKVKGQVCEKMGIQLKTHLLVKRCPLVVKAFGDNDKKHL